MSNLYVIHHRPTLNFKRCMACGILIDGVNWTRRIQDWKKLENRCLVSNKKEDTPIGGSPASL